MDYTRFEEARLIGARALQIELGAPIFVKVTDPKAKSLEIAKIELENDLLPLTVKRK